MFLNKIKRQILKTKIENDFLIDVATVSSILSVNYNIFECVDK